MKQEDEDSRHSEQKFEHLAHLRRLMVRVLLVERGESIETGAGALDVRVVDHDITKDLTSKGKEMKGEGDRDRPAHPHLRRIECLIPRTSPLVFVARPSTILILFIHLISLTRLSQQHEVSITYLDLENDLNTVEEALLVDQVLFRDGRMVHHCQCGLETLRAAVSDGPAVVRCAEGPATCISFSTGATGKEDETSYSPIEYTRYHFSKSSSFL
jgi:hypothetical protein